MRALTTVAVLFAVMAVLAPPYLWAIRRQQRARRTPDETAIKRARDIYLALDAATDTIARLLVEDKNRFLFTEDERIELRAHVVRFENIQNR